MTRQLLSQLQNPLPPCSTTDARIFTIAPREIFTLSPSFLNTINLRYVDILPYLHNQCA